MPIPTKPARPADDLGKKLILIYGDAKRGKSTLAAQFPGHIFLATEAGLGSLPHAARWVYDPAKETDDANNYVIRTWDDLLKATAEAIECKQFKTIIIDTVGNMCDLAEAHVCKKNNVDYRGDGVLGYGKGAAMIRNELKRYFSKIAGSGMGVIMLAHAAEREISTAGGEVKKRVPVIPADNKEKELYTAILGACDCVFYLDIESGKTVVKTKPRVQYDAGERSGRMPESVSCSYELLAKAYASAQTVPTAPVATTTAAPVAATK